MEYSATAPRGKDMRSAIQRISIKATTAREQEFLVEFDRAYRRRTLASVFCQEAREEAAESKRYLARVTLDGRFLTPPTGILDAEAVLNADQRRRLGELFEQFQLEGADVFTEAPR